MSAFVTLNVKRILANKRTAKVRLYAAAFPNNGHGKVVSFQVMDGTRSVCEVELTPEQVRELAVYLLANITAGTAPEGRS